MSLLVCENASFAYDGMTVVKGLSFEVEPVSYTHLDVYKRQILSRANYGGR